MSLDARYDKIENYKEICYVDRVIPASQGGDGVKTQSELNPITYVLVFRTIPIGMREITEDNWYEFYCRMVAFDAIVGGPISEWPEEEPNPIYRSVTKEEVKQHIGLSTNASTYTDAEFGEALGRTIQSQKRYNK